MGDLDLAEKAGDVELFRSLLHKNASTHDDLAESIIICSDCGWFADLHMLTSQFREMEEAESPSRLSEQARLKRNKILRWHEKVYVHSLQETSPPDSKEFEIEILRLMNKDKPEELFKLLEGQFKHIIEKAVVQRNVILRATIFLLNKGFISDELIAEPQILPRRKISFAELAKALSGNLSYFREKYMLYRYFVFVSAQSGVPALSHFAVRNSDLHLEAKASPKLNYVHSEKKKVAVCISGMARNHAHCFKIIKQNLIDPLEADLFVHTWDVEQLWPGFAGSVNMARCLGGGRAAHLPNELKKVEGFKKMFPRTGELLSKPTSTLFDAETFERIYRPQKLVVEKNDEFGQDFPFDVEKLAGRGNLNQAKMFYKLHAVHTLMEQHEKETGIQYDYVVRTRPDILFTKTVDISSFEHLSANEVGLHTMHRFGPDDQFAIFNRATADVYNGLWPEISARRSLSPFAEHPNADSHYLMMLWFLSNNLAPIMLNISKSLSAATIDCVPNFKADLEADLQDTAKKYSDAEWVTLFYNSIFPDRKSGKWWARARHWVKGAKLFHK